MGDKAPKDSGVKKDQPDKRKEREVKIDKDKRIPETEWKLIALAATKVSGPKRCHYFNSSMGCALADKCSSSALA